jgi:hypothetical protein
MYFEPLQRLPRGWFGGADFTHRSRISFGIRENGQEVRNADAYRAHLTLLSVKD